MARYESWFGVEFEFLLYDVTSTYFEGDAAGNAENAKAKRGCSRDNRPDCKQVNIGLVVTPEGGLPIGYEVFDGNTADVTHRRGHGAAHGGQIRQGQAHLSDRSRHGQRGQN